MGGGNTEEPLSIDLKLLPASRDSAINGETLSSGACTDIYTHIYVHTSQQGPRDRSSITSLSKTIKWVTSLPPAWFPYQEF